MRMRVAALARNGVDRLHIVRAPLVEELVGHGDNLVFAHARFQFLVDHVVDAIDHACGLRQQLDLVPILDLARREHDLLAIHHIQTSLFQGLEHGGFGIIHAHRHAFHARILNEARDVFGVFLHQAKARRDGAAHADNARVAVIRHQPVGVFAVMHRSRAKVPDMRRVIAREQGKAAHLVAFPLADLGRGHIADVVDIKQQKRACAAFPQCFAGAAQPVAAQPVVIDTALEIHLCRAPCGQAAFPLPIGLQILWCQDVRGQCARHSSSFGYALTHPFIA